MPAAGARADGRPVARADRLAARRALPRTA